MQPERAIQADFFDAVRGAGGNADRFGNAEIYRKLIFYRFEETLSAAYPLFKKEVGKRRWKRWVKGYIAQNPETPFMWRMPEGFGKYVRKEMKKKGMKRRRYRRDLLWFEWNEVAAMMAPSPIKSAKRVDFSRVYRRGESVRMRRLRHPAMLGKREPKAVYPTLVHQTGDGGVAWRILTPFLYELIRACDGKRPLGKIVCSLCRSGDIDEKSARKVLQKGLRAFLKQGVLTPVH
ncbi:DNA-binding domain-containing protein [Hydrogenimonas sp. SS33]|uniref:DNA-binding domain-containing protein n=1 Tax=Hydrogenimonas leucolamina TaxID=2954236 RepID=UPI00336C196C